MTIHNFYLVSACTLWLLVLLCLLMRIAVGGMRQSVRSRKEKRIARFFLQDCPPRKFRQRSRQVLRYSEDDMLMNYICECYAADTEKQSRNRKLMVHVLNRRIDRLPKNDRGARCRLARDIDRCALSSWRIDRFLRQYAKDFPGEAEGSEMIQLNIAR